MYSFYFGTSQILELFLQEYGFVIHDLIKMLNILAFVLKENICFWDVVTSLCGMALFLSRVPCCKGQKTVTVFPPIKRAQADVEKVSLRLLFVGFLYKNTQRPGTGICKLARNLLFEFIYNK